jgi:superfamily II DNA or RNA helicase
MEYFSNHYSDLKFPFSTVEIDGLRNAQIGALHAIGSYFTLYKKNPALIVMPTGSGKTTVLVLSAFLLSAKRVLVITPSVLVRGQIFDEFIKLKTAKELKALPSKLQCPKVFEQKNNLFDADDWKNLEKYDVVVGTPNSISYGISEDFKPDENLFDLVLIDEAHHSPAKSWDSIIECFPQSKRIFFTATPFRRDKREIIGDIIYNYPLSQAYEDKIFGEISFYPIKKDLNPAIHDLLIAKNAERIFLEDRKAGLEHYLFVRTSTKVHAKDLEKLYKEKTTLNLRRIDSTKTYSYIKQSIKKLKSSELDGIICVDMLGEGFDFPNLKIAAIHSPHKSLAITLQFIGRFARTNTQKIKNAKFIAITNEEFDIENNRLYAEDAIWKDIIIELSEGKISVEDETKKSFKTFHPRITSLPDETKISLYSLFPYFHVKIYSVGGFNINGVLNLPEFEVVFHQVSKELSSIVILAKESTRPKWIKTDELVDIKNFLFLIYYDEKTNLLFINSTIRKSIDLYEEILSAFSTGHTSMIPKSRLNKVLADLTDREFFNIGMLNRLNNTGESYRIITGQNAEKAIKKSDGRLYSGGHVFAKAMDSENNSLTIGYSSASKVWSNIYEKIPVFIDWCKVIAAKISSDKKVITNSGFDNLSVGEIIDRFPASVYSISWNSETFKDAPFLEVVDEDGLITQYQLLDFDIKIVEENSNLEEIEIYLSNSEVSIELLYNFQDHFTDKNRSPVEYFVSWGASQRVDLILYLNEYSPTFYLKDFSSISYHEWHKSPPPEKTYFNSDHIEVLDWSGVNIQKEFGTKNSIHTFLINHLRLQDLDIIIYDHGTGEIADFIAIKEEKEAVKIELIHVKAATGKDATGERVDDVYEVCGQAVKSLVWVTNKTPFRKNIERRTSKHPEKYLKGTNNEFLGILSKDKVVYFQISIVQPGISKSNIIPKISEVLTANDDYISNSGNNFLRVYASA